MGILNLTEDSFSDGARFLHPDDAFAHAMNMIEAGADILDLGAESTRPGAFPVKASLEIERLVPIIRRLRSVSDVTISIDTRKALVAQEAITAGANLINDVSALGFDSDMINVISSNPDVDIVLMHCQGEPQYMQVNPQYNDVVSEVYDFFRNRIETCKTSGIGEERIIIDPGIGFGKNLEHNLRLIASLDRFKDLGCRILLGASRKSFINLIDPSPPENRTGGSIAAAIAGSLQGIDILRIHDVAIHRQFFSVFSQVIGEGRE